VIDVLLSQYRQVAAHAPNRLKGLYVIPSSFDLKLWFGLMFVKTGPYKSGMFHFRILFTDDYPTESPILFFEKVAGRHILHPLVDKNTGEFNLIDVFDHFENSGDNLALDILEQFMIDFTLRRKSLTPIRNEATWNLYKKDKELFQSKVSLQVHDSYISGSHDDTFQPIGANYLNSYQHSSFPIEMFAEIRMDLIKTSGHPHRGVDFGISTKVSSHCLKKKSGVIPRSIYKDN
ncbi:hypothetical protein AKO1_010078, partial [Acrasis kona]